MVPVGVVGEQSLHDAHVAPLAAEPAVTVIDPDLAKPGRGAEPAAGGVLREDARHQLPETLVTTGVCQPVDEGAAGTAATGLAGDVDAELTHSRVARARPVRRRPREADHRAPARRDDRGVGAVVLLQHAADLLRAARLGLEGGDAVLDALVVDAGDGAGAGAGGEADGGV